MVFISSHYFIVQEDYNAEALCQPKLHINFREQIKSSGKSQSCIIHSLGRSQRHHFLIEITHSLVIYKKKKLQDLTSVPQSCSDTLHGQDEGVLQSGGILTCRVQLHQFGLLVRDLLRQGGAHIYFEVRVSNPLQCESLADVQSCYIGLTQAYPLFQVRVCFENIRVACNLHEQDKRNEIRAVYGKEFSIQLKYVCIESISK